jgi:hypothetical protein
MRHALAAADLLDAIELIGRINALFTPVQQLLTAVASTGNHAMHHESG